MDRLEKEGNTGPKQPKELLEAAHSAAARREPGQMIEALAASGFLDGLVRRIAKKWEHLPRSEVEECVARAVDSAYDAIAQGRQVRNLGSWLWKAADNTASDCWYEEYALRSTDDAMQTVASIPPISPPERRRSDIVADKKRGEAIRLARGLLPRIGQGQVVNVMGLIIDAVEREIQDLSPAEIGDALGITGDAARTLVRRGFERLEREARRDGIELPKDLFDSNGDEVDNDDTGD